PRDRPVPRGRPESLARRAQPERWRHSTPSTASRATPPTPSTWARRTCRTTLQPTPSRSRARRTRPRRQRPPRRRRYRWQWVRKPRNPPPPTPTARARPDQFGSAPAVSSAMAAVSRCLLPARTTPSPLANPREDRLRTRLEHRSRYARRSDQVRPRTGPESAPTRLGTPAPPRSPATPV